MSDVLDILDIDRPQTPDTITRESFMGSDLKRKRRKLIDNATFKRPEGMHRELFALLYNDPKRDAPPLIQTDTTQGYKQIKAKLGLKRVRSWKWVKFNNPARKDNITLFHWRRAQEENKEYPFARFNKTIQAPNYTDDEYQHLVSDTWSRTATDYLFDMCQRFDLRFIIIHDRWDREAFVERTIEDMKERYYSVHNTLAKLRAVANQEPTLIGYDGDNERRRKEQLIKLYNRTQEQVEEEQNLLNELRKIEQRKKEREKKTQDLQKLITASDAIVDSRKPEKKGGIKRKFPAPKSTRVEGLTFENAGIKFPDVKVGGVSLRSHRMKLPTTVGQKKTKTIESLLQELNIDQNPMPTPEICTHFNELRSDMVYLYELKMALATLEYEAQSMRHRVEALAPGKVLDIPTTIIQVPSTPGTPTDSPSKSKSISEIIELANTGPSVKKIKKFLQDHHYFR